MPENYGNAFIFFQKTLSFLLIHLSLHRKFNN